MDVTSIRICKQTKAALDCFKRAGESYDTVLLRLLAASQQTDSLSDCFWLWSDMTDEEKGIINRCMDGTY